MRVLVVSEYHILNTGYATYYKNICQALHEAGHVVSELASYGNENIPEHVWAAEKCPWQVYLNIPEVGTQRWNRFREMQRYADADFGAWDFENTVLDCKPDVVIAIRDPWYDRFIIESPLSKYYKTILCPTVDSRPLRADWLEMYSKVDVLTSYNLWSENWLREQFNLPNIVNCINPGVKKEFRRLDINYTRKLFKLNPKDKIVLTVMRNQGRKRYPDLFSVINSLKDTSVKLHCHTHFEDRGWDLTKLALQYGILDRLLFTFKCTECYGIEIDHLNQNKMCSKCGSRTEVASVREGVNDEELNLIYNNCNLYVQWHTNEGLGFPPIEAAATGKRILTVNFSAQEDVVNKVKGIAVEPLALQREIYSLRYMAVPNNAKLIELLDDDKTWTYDEKEIIKSTKDFYNWDNCGKEWVKLVESIEPLNNWDQTKHFQNPPPLESLMHFNNHEFIKACIVLVAQDPSILGTYTHAEALSRLNDGHILPVKDKTTGEKHNKPIPVTKASVYKEFLSKLHRERAWEKEKLVRAQKENLNHSAKN